MKFLGFLVYSLVCFLHRRSCHISSFSVLSVPFSPLTALARTSSMINEKALPGGDILGLVLLVKKREVSHHYDCIRYFGRCSIHGDKFAYTPSLLALSS